MQAEVVKMQTFLLNGSQQAGVDTHDLPTQEQKKMKYCSLSVASLALLWYGAAHAQTENTSTNTSTWPAHNRYVALNLGQQQQQYRELDTQGLTSNGTGNVATEYSAHIGYALNADIWGVMPRAWQITPLLQLSLVPAESKNAA